MSNQPTDQFPNPSESAWVPPDPMQLQIALENRRSKRPKTVHRTIVMKLHKPSRRKEQAILWAQTHVTNMTGHILETLREDPLLPADAPLRTDGALAFVLEMLSRKAQGATGDRVNVLADVLSECFRAGTKHSTTNSQNDTKVIIKQKPADVPKLTGTDYPITGPLRDGVFRGVALMLLNWYLRIVGELPEDEQDEQQEAEEESTTNETAPPLDLAPIVVPDLATVYSLWASKCVEYEGAAGVVVPIGRHRGKTLKEVGKREARWLRERLIPPKLIDETLIHVAVLLDPLSTNEQRRKARQARHPWRRRTNLQRAPRAGRLVQQTFDLPAPLIRLETLNADELRNLQTELEEMRNFAIEFERIREAVDIFLSPAPPRYPTVQHILNAGEREEAKDQYDDALDKLATRVLSFERETETTTHLLRAESMLDKPDFQPLSFKRTMIPHGATSFALLYSTTQSSREVLERKYKRMSKAKRQRKIDEVMAQGQIYTYTLAMVVHGAEAFKGDDPPERFEPEVRPGLFYVNFPRTPFEPPEGASLLLFPLECGEEYHEQQFLRTIIDVQSHRQVDKFEQERAKPRPVETVAEPGKRTKQSQELTLASCFPTAAIRSARVTSKRTPEGYWEFYLHLPVESPTPTIINIPDTVIGFHEHGDGYSYAVLDFKGNVIETANVFIPLHVRLKEGDRSYSDNYVFEVANTMVALAQRQAGGERLGSLIGIEKSNSRKNSVHLSRSQNWLQFARPSVKLAKVLKYKVGLAGLLRQHRTWGVSPNRCSHCGTKRAPGTKNRYPRMVRCPTCRSADLHCSRCGTERMVGSSEVAESRPCSNGEDGTAIGHMSERIRALPPANCPRCDEESGVVFDELRCADCDGVWRVHEPWFSCDACGHNQPVRLNTAILVAQLTLTQIVLNAKENRNAAQKKPRKPTPNQKRKRKT